jgi:single-strand DNA-binding protein
MSRINVSETTVIGGLTKDVEVREVNGNKVANFTIAVQRDYKDAEGNYGTDYYDCEVWGKTAEYMGKGVKGQAASATGRFESRSYTDKEGKRRIQWSLKVRKAGLGDLPGAKSADVADPIDDEDAIPFS